MRPTATAACDTMKANGNYVKGVGYALNKLGEIPNVYNYIDAGHHGWLGWDDNFAPSAQLFYQAATAEGATVDDVHGFITNTANYSALKENNYTINDSVAASRSASRSGWTGTGTSTSSRTHRASAPSWSPPASRSGIGMLIDTSRNGWGGTARPTGPGATTSVDTYVNGGRYDRRIHVGNWCNQSGARPRRAPAGGSGRRDRRVRVDEAAG